MEGVRVVPFSPFLFSLHRSSRSPSSSDCDLTPPPPPVIAGVCAARAATSIPERPFVPFPVNPWTERCTASLQGMDADHDCCGTQPIRRAPG